MVVSLDSCAFSGAGYCEIIGRDFSIRIIRSRANTIIGACIHGIICADSYCLIIFDKVLSLH